MAAGAQILPFPQGGDLADDDGPARSVSKLKKDFINSVGAKSAENREAAEADRYFHGVQWTGKDLKTLESRNQPPVTFNRVKRKINTICGIIERLRMGPKALPRNPQRQAEDGAEIASKVLLYALGWQWTDLSITVARRCAVRGIAGAELVLVEGDQGDPEVEWDEIDARDFFYDERSTKLDFSDARFLGTTRWIALDEAIEAWPEHEEELSTMMDSAPVVESDRGDERREVAWTSPRRKRLRITDHWYQIGSTWHYCIYTGTLALEWGESYLHDERKRSMHKFELLSFEVDHDGDRYGALRDLKSPQDEINHRRSKALHQLNSRKVVADAGAVDDVEVARREYARADGWVIKNPGREIITEDAQAASVVQGNMEMLNEAKTEIDTYGPNPGLIGTDIPADSGRAIKLLQAAGIAELGSYMMAYKQWRLRVYRKTWNAVQQVWTGPRWIRVTDDENLAQFIQVNGWEKDEAGNVQVLNELAALDVDIVIDEGDDVTTTMEETFDTLVQLGKGGASVPPEMFIELSPLPSSTKQRIMQQIAASQQPKPLDQQAIMLQLQLVQAQIMELQSKAEKNMADAQKSMIEAQTPPTPGQIDTPADLAKADLDVAKATEIRHKIEVGSHVPEQRLPTPEQPGLFDVNQAKAREHHARAMVAETQAQMGWDEYDTHAADRQLKGAQTMAAMAQAEKIREEAQTIRDAPPGMLSKPPPRPASVPSIGKRK